MRVAPLLAGREAMKARSILVLATLVAGTALAQSKTPSFETANLMVSGTRGDRDDSTSVRVEGDGRALVTRTAWDRATAAELADAKALLARARRITPAKTDGARSFALMWPAPDWGNLRVDLDLAALGRTDPETWRLVLALRHAGQR